MHEFAMRLFSVQHTTARCSKLQHSTAHCNTLQHTATQKCMSKLAICSVLCATHNSTLHNTLRHPATHSNILQRKPPKLACTNSRCALYSVQHTTPHSSTLQDTATNWNRLQLTATHLKTNLPRRLQGGDASQDALSRRSFFANEPLIIGFFCGK